MSEILQELAYISSILFGAIATAAAIFVILAEIQRRRTTPRFVVGVLPDPAEIKKKGLSQEDIGIPISYEKNLRFNPKYFAKETYSMNFTSNLIQKTIALARKFRKNLVLQKAKKVETAVREIAVKDDHVPLFVVIQNRGKRVATKITLVIEFNDPRIQITDMELEGLQAVSVCTSHPEEFKKEKFQEKMIPKIIAKKYEELGESGRMTSSITLTGSMESEICEIIYIETKMPSDLKSFVTYFDIDCPGEYWKEKRYTQTIALIR